MRSNELGKMKTWETVLGWCYFPMYLLGAQLIVGVILLLRGYDLHSEGTLLALNLWTSVVHFVAIIAIFHRFLLEQFRRIKGSVGRLIGVVAIGCVMYYGGSIVVNLITAIMTKSLGAEITNQNQEALVQMIKGDVMQSTVIISLCGPIVEECLMRGLIFRPLRPRSRVLAYALSMLVFASLHVVSSIVSGGTNLVEVLLNLLAYLPGGFALAWVYERTKTIWASIFTHLTVNTLVLLLIYATPTV